MTEIDRAATPQPAASGQAGRLTWAPRLRRLMVGIDLSPASENLARIAVSWVSQHWLAKLTLVHVVPTQVPRWGELMVGAKALPQRVLNARQRLRSLRAKLDPDVEIDCYVATGNEVTELCKSAEKVEADLVLMSAGVRPGAALGLRGTVAEAVVRRAPCSVVVLKESLAEAPDDERPGIKHLLLAYDGSPGSAAALNVAWQYAKHGLERISVVRPVDASLIVTPPYTDPSDGHQQLLEAKEEAKRVLEQAPPEIATDLDVQVGAPWRVITEAAERLRPDLVMVGEGEARGLSGFLSLKRTTSERVVRHAGCSVFVVKPGR